MQEAELQENRAPPRKDAEDDISAWPTTTKLSPREIEQFKRWKFLIVVVDCSQGPRLHNPPRSVRALKSRLATALGIEALSKEHGGAGSEAASAQSIVTGLEGPERHMLEQDDELCSFWDRVSAISGVPELEHTDEGVRRLSKGLYMAPSGFRALNSVDGSRTGSRGGSRGSSAIRGRRPMLPPQMQQMLQMQQMPQMLHAPVSTASSGTPTAAAHAVLPTHMSPPSPALSQGVLNNTAELEAEVHDLSERCKAAEEELSFCQNRFEDCTAELEMVRDELEAAQRNEAESQEKMVELRNLSEHLQEQNLAFIRTFEQQLEQSKDDIRKEVADKFQAHLDEAGRKIVEAEGQSRRLEGQLQITLDKIKDLEAALRRERSTARRCEAALEKEHARAGELEDKINQQASRLRQMEFYADSWRRKVSEIADARMQALAQPDLHFEFRVMDVSAKIRSWSKGRMAQSPEFHVPKLGSLQFEFFPAGEINSRPGWSSLRVHVPNGTRLRWKAKVGKRDFEPREDHYDTRQWWNRYGIQYLNLCQAEELLSEVAVDSDSVLIGFEVLEILPMVDEPPSSAAISVDVDPSDQIGPPEVAVPLRPNTAPQSVPSRAVASTRPASLPQCAASPSGTAGKGKGSEQREKAMKPVYAFGAGTSGAAHAAAAYVVKSGNLPPAVAASRRLQRPRSMTSLRQSVAH